MFDFKNSSEKQVILDLLRKAGSDDRAVATEATAKFAIAAVQTPIREVLLSGDITAGIFTPLDYTDNPRVEFPIDLLTPGAEREHYAYVMPAFGNIPHKQVAGDYLMVPTYRTANSIDCTLRLIRDANWPVIARMIEIMRAGFVKKLNDDAWQTLISAATDRNIMIFDPNATAGQFTPRLVTLMQTFMRRNGGGNSTTTNRSKLTDLYVSPEALTDIRAWNLELIADGIRERIYTAPDGSSQLMNVYGTNLHDLDELGEGQEYQLYYTSTLGGSLNTGDYELVVGLDKSRNDSFIHPVRQTLKVYEDNTQHRHGMFSLYGDMEGGFAVLDSRRTILGSF